MGVHVSVKQYLCLRRLRVAVAAMVLHGAVVVGASSNLGRELGAGYRASPPSPRGVTEYRSMHRVRVTAALRLGVIVMNVQGALVHKYRSSVERTQMHGHVSAVYWMYRHQWRGTEGSTQDCIRPRTALHVE